MDEVPSVASGEIKAPKVLDSRPASKTAPPRGDSSARSAVPKVAQPLPPPERERSSSPAAGIIVAIVVFVCAATAVYFLFIRKPAGNDAGSTTGSAGIVTPTLNGTGSAGSGSAAPPIAVVTPDAAPAAPAAELVDTTIKSSVKGATVAITGGATGPAPFTTKLEKGKVFQATVTAPGFAATSVEVTGGGPTVTASLTAKKRILHVSSEPSGAKIWIEGSNTDKVTPADIELTTAQGEKASVRVVLRRTGYGEYETMVKRATFAEDDTAIAATVKGTLVARKPSGGSSSDGATPSGGGDKPPTDKPPADKPPADKPPTDKPPQPAGSGAPATDKPATDKPAGGGLKPSGSGGGSLGGGLKPSGSGSAGSGSTLKPAPSEPAPDWTK